MSVFAGDKYFSFIGGGGEPDGETTIFDPEIPFVGDYVKKSRPKHVNISFNGGHGSTEKKLEESFGDKNNSFTMESFHQIIQSYADQIRSGEIKSGDQVVVYLSTHGARKKDSENTHHIAFAGSDGTSDLVTLEGANTASLDELKVLSELALKHDVKLGIIDDSCHSGNSLALANKNTCVVSSSGPDLFGFASTAFSKNLKKGRSLEDYFLKARERHPITFGQISDLLKITF